ncbi:SPP1 phage holin [Popillia japonica]|uniref:SPP1 phage holin n=1 Tax=Popillia japonica TaxID=7064 RepID=A0AAW1HV45_POPJA
MVPSRTQRALPLTTHLIPGVTASVKLLAVNMENMLEAQKSQGARLEKLESEPGENWKSMKRIVADTIARTIVLAIALINQVLAIAGKGTLDIAENDIYQVVTVIFTIGTAVLSWWKNNSITQAAIVADETLKEIKKGE